MKIQVVSTGERGEGYTNKYVGLDGLNFMRERWPEQTAKALADCGNPTTVESLGFSLDNGVDCVMMETWDVQQEPFPVRVVSRSITIRYGNIRFRFDGVGWTMRPEGCDNWVSTTNVPEPVRRLT